MLSIKTPRIVHRFLLGAIGAVLFSLAASAEPAATVKLLTVDIQVAADGTATRTDHYEIAANNDAAALKVGQTGLPYDASIQDVNIVDAHTLKPDGKSIPVRADAIYDQLPPGVAPGSAITNLRVKTIVFPQFSAGDVAVYTLTMVTKIPLFPGKFWYSELYSRTIAFDEVRETITAPKSMPLIVENHDVDFKKSEQGGNVVYSWHYSAPSPVQPELKLVSPADSEPRFLVSSFASYDELGRAYAGVSDSKMIPTASVTALADQITAGISDRRDQAKAIYEWVSRHIRYVAVELGRGSYVPHDPDAIISNGYGDCKDHVVVLGALLKAKGIKSESVLINSGNNYTLPKVPTFAPFDHVISWLPEFDVYLDSSMMLAPFGVLSLVEYGKPAVRATLSDAATITMPLIPEGAATVSTKTDTRLDQDGHLTGTTTTTATGPYSVFLRTVGLGIQNEGSESAAAQVLAKLGYGNATGTFVVGSLADLSPVYSISSSFNSSGWSDKVTNSAPFYIPGGLRLFGLSGDGPLGPLYPGQLKDSEPVICGSTQMSEVLTFHPPPGLKIAEVPPDTNVETQYLSFTAHWVLQDGVLSVHRDFASHIDRPLCSPEIRRQNAAALKAISDNYDTNLRLVPTGR